MKILICIISLLSLTGCIPNTYYSTTDDYVIGLRWFDRGREHGNVKFFQNAIKYWEPLLAQDDCDAEYQMGLVYYMGAGKTQSFKNAYMLWKKAANGNQQRAKWALGDMHFQSEEDVFHHCSRTPNCNLEKNLETALFWYKLFERSAKYPGEVKYAEIILTKLTSMLSESQVKEIESKVEKWNPTPKDCRARNLW